ISVWPGVTQIEYNGLGVGRNIQLRNTDYELVNQLLEDQIEYKSAIYSVWGGIVAYNEETGNYSVEGVHPDFQFIENASIVKGRFITHADVNNYEKTAIIGQKVANDLFKNNEDPLGKNITVSGMIYKVVGVFTDAGGE